jgi:phosphate transport system permease protein
LTKLRIHGDARVPRRARLSAAFGAFALGALVMLAAGREAGAREEIRIVGSSTVFPFATTVAEQFSKGSSFKSPVVEATGTGGGIKLFCNDIDIDTPDIANASRTIKASEIETCRKNGVVEIAEVKIGYDGIVLANSRSHATYRLTVGQIWLALAKSVPVDGRLSPNPYRTWEQIDPSLPAERIEVLGPPPTSGTRDAFVELVMDAACEQIPEIRAIADPDAKKAACQTVREDGAYVEAGENDNLIVQKLEANPAALGIFGFSFLQQNSDKLQGSHIGGVAPSFEAIASGEYAVSRSLYFYVKNAHVGRVPGLKEYVAEFMSEAASGEGGYLAGKGLIPLSPAERAQVVPAALALQPMGGAAAMAPTVTMTTTVRPPLAEGWSGMLQPLTVGGLLVLTGIAYATGRRRAVAAVGGRPQRLHSLPSYHGLHVALWCVIPSLVLAALWLILEPHILRALVVASLPPELAAKPDNELGLVLNDIQNLANRDAIGSAADPVKLAAAERLIVWRQIGAIGFAAAVATIGLAGLLWGRRAIAPSFRARNTVERTILILMIILSTISILTTVGIVLSLLFESLRFFAQVSVFEFLFGLQWSPQTAIRADQVGSSGAFGAVPLFAGTLLITLIAMIVAVPIGLMAAVYMADYASPRLRALAKPALEVLAGIPTVVYGFFAALTVAPFIRDAGQSIGLDVASESALAAGVVMGIMIVPFVSSLSDDVMNAVPQSLRDGAFALGATKSETIRQVVIPAALPGIVGAVLLAVSRAIGETMIVVMAAGLTANLTANPLEAVSTVTVQIATLLVGDQEFDSAKTLSAFALGLMLFSVTLVLNVVALGIVRRYREKYD